MAEEVYGLSEAPYSDALPKPKAMGKVGIKRVITAFVNLDWYMFKCVPYPTSQDWCCPP